jgi:hypothetical protein
MSFLVQRCWGSRWVMSEAREVLFGGLAADRIMLALLDGTQPPTGRFPESTNIVQLYGDADRSEVHRIDDLIVRLYWLIYRHTRQDQLT